VCSENGADFCDFVGIPSGNQQADRCRHAEIYTRIPEFLQLFSTPSNPFPQFFFSATHGAMQHGFHGKLGSLRNKGIEIFYRFGGAIHCQSFWKESHAKNPDRLHLQMGQNNGRVGGAGVGLGSLNHGSNAKWYAAQWSGEGADAEPTCQSEGVDRNDHTSLLAESYRATPSDHA
jgi:hypothetical protein